MTAVLYRNNDSALPLIDLLEQKGVPYACRQREGFFFTSPLVRDVTDMLEFAFDDSNKDLFLLLEVVPVAHVPHQPLDGGEAGQVGQLGVVGLHGLDFFAFDDGNKDLFLRFYYKIDLKLKKAVVTRLLYGMPQG